MLGGKLFDSKDMGPYTTENLKKIQMDSLTVSAIGTAAVAATVAAWH